MTAASLHARAHLIEFDLNAEDGCRAREWAVRLEFPPRYSSAISIIALWRRNGVVMGIPAHR
jgi:hypothetical protein